MTHISTRYTPVWRISLTKADIDQLMLCSERHYDSVCQSLSTTNGRIRQFLAHIEFMQTAEVYEEVNWTQVDLICKVLEGSRTYGFTDVLFMSFHKLLIDQTKKDTTTT
jgi:hypothetical protein